MFASETTRTCASPNKGKQTSTAPNSPIMRKRTRVTSASREVSRVDAASSLPSAKHARAPRTALVRASNITLCVGAYASLWVLENKSPSFSRKISTREGGAATFFSVLLVSAGNAGGSVILAPPLVF